MTKFSHKRTQGNEASLTTTSLISQPLQLYDRFPLDSCKTPLKSPSSSKALAWFSCFLFFPPTFSPYFFLTRQSDSFKTPIRSVPFQCLLPLRRKQFKCPQSRSSLAHWAPATWAALLFFTSIKQNLAPRPQHLLLSLLKSSCPICLHGCSLTCFKSMFICRPPTRPCSVLHSTQGHLISSHMFVQSLLSLSQAKMQLLWQQCSACWSTKIVSVPRSVVGT